MDCQIKMGLTYAEREELRRRAAAEGMGMTDYIRRAIGFRYVRVLEIESLAEMDARLTQRREV